jgi:hypothetical protein
MGIGIWPIVLGPDTPSATSVENALIRRPVPGIQDARRGAVTNRTDPNAIGAIEIRVLIEEVTILDDMIGFQPRVTHWHSIGLIPILPIPENIERL